MVQNGARWQPCSLPPAVVSAYARRQRLTENSRLQEVRVASGLILLLLVGVLIGFGWARIRRRMGLGVTWSTWAVVIAVTVIGGLLLWVTQAKH